MRIITDICFATLGPGATLIFTDCAAVLALRAFEAKNSSADGHAVNDNFVIIRKRRKCTIQEKKKTDGNEIIEEKELNIFTVNVHHFIAETTLKGKK